jgi:hypothetical protein
LSLCTGCLGCLEYSPFGHVSARICHLQGKDDKACPHVVLYASAHHHVCAQMVGDGEIYKACRGLEIGYVSHELGCRHKTRKVAPGEGGTLGGIRCGQYRPLGGIGSDAADAQLSHAPAHAVAGRACKFCVLQISCELGSDLAKAKAPVAFLPYRADGFLDRTP